MTPSRDPRSQPLQNRVTPFGDLIAAEARGALMGNRGRLHDDARRIVRWSRGIRWIACRLEFKGRQREVMAPGRYTELFFLDEATSLAAGHRPCAECRRADFNRFRAAWSEALGSTRRWLAPDIDAVLDGERSHGERWRTASAVPVQLPDGAFVELDGHAHIVVGGRMARWSPEGYGPAVVAPSRAVPLLTPPSIVAAMVAGYRPAVSASRWRRPPPPDVVRTPPP